MGLTESQLQQHYFGSFPTTKATKEDAMWDSCSLENQTVITIIVGRCSSSVYLDTFFPALACFFGHCNNNLAPIKETVFFSFSYCWLFLVSMSLRKLETHIYTHPQGIEWRGEKRCNRFLLHLFSPLHSIPCIISSLNHFLSVHYHCSTD